MVKLGAIVEAVEVVDSPEECFGHDDGLFQFAALAESFLVEAIVGQMDAFLFDISWIQ